MDPVDVNGLPLPPLLTEMLRTGQWRHPGDAVIAKLIPFLPDPVDFLTSIDSMRRESPKSMAGDPELDRIFHFVADPGGVSVFAVAGREPRRVHRRLPVRGG
jgi:hypothetical protein